MKNFINRALVAKKHLKLFFALFAMLALGVGNAWADVNCDFTTKSASHGAYTDSWKYGDFTVFGGANNNKGWAYVKMGGKSTNLTTANPVYISSPKMTSAISKVQVSIIAGSLAKSGMSVNSWGVYVYSDANMTNQVDYVAGGTISKNAAVFEFTPTTGTTWSANNYYKVSFDLKNTTTTNGIIWLDKVTFVESTNGGGETPVASLVKIEKTAGKTEFVEGEAFEKATITATYDDETTKDVTSLATFTGYNMNTTGTQTVTVTYEDQTITYNITVNPKPTYTITWNNAGDDSNTTTVVQGAALGELPTVADCSNGKKFMGWTAATSVNNDGSGVTYIESTDKPTANTTYYAVFAVVEGDAGTPTTATVSISDYATEKNWVNSTQYGTVNIDANITATATGGGNTGKYYTSGTNWRLYQNETPSLTISAAEGYEIQTVKVTYSVSNTGVLTLDGSNVTSGTACEVNAASVTFGVGNTGSATNGQVRITKIEVTYAPAAKKSDYSLNCDIHQDPYLTVLKTAIDFGTVAQNETVTETLNVNGGYLAENVTLTISGANASFFAVNPTTIAKANEVDQDVTITYNPTATGEHTAILTIKTGDITKTVDLSGTVLAPGKWVLVKNVTELSAGDEVIIASSISNYAIGTAATNNYKGAAITKVGETANTTTDVTILTVEETGIAEAPYAFKTNSKYLYAASSSANQLKAQATNNANGQWAVTITAEGVVSIVAAKSSNRNVMQCNPNGGSPIFACYESASASYEALAIYRNSENVAKPVISGEGDFVGSTQVTITAKSGLIVYYTTDGSTPDKTATQYSTPFTISATTTVKAIAYDATDNASAVAEMTFTKHNLVNVATAMALPVDDIAYLSQFEVVYPLKDKSYIYIKDNSGYGLIYDGTLDEQFKAGDRVEGFVGTSSPYKSLPELKAVNKYEDLTITPGVAAEPIEFVTAPTVTDVNKYVVFKNVQFDAAVTFATDAATNTTFTIGSETITLRNNYKFAASLEANMAYDVYGFVATFQQNEGDPIQVQVYFLTAVEAGGVIETYTVTYDANGATGAAPVDETKYQAGQTFYIENQGGLVKEGYEFVGWKYNGTVYEAGKQFTMPTENVTFVAQWEEIVVTPREDFSAGLWVLVTDASELAADDYIIVAAKDYNVAMVSYDYDVRKNNCGQTNITKFGNNNCFLTWKEEIGVFQLANSGSGYTIQDVNTEQYLYAAGTGTKNYLQAADEVPTDAEAAKPYIWTISYTDGVATVKATSDNRNTLMYNATNNSGQLFSCYASGQKAIALYKYVTDFYTRDVTVNNHGTICLPYASSKFAGAEFYEVAYLEPTKGLWLDQLAEDAVLEAGKPYIFKATDAKIVVAYEGAAEPTPVAGVNGLTGTFTDITAGGVQGHYIIAQNQIWVANELNTLPANRAYINATVVPKKVQPEIPGRRRVCMGENEATGFENIVAPEGQAVKAIVNGQLIIIRDGVKYNVQGVRF